MNRVLEIIVSIIFAWLSIIFAGQVIQSFIYIMKVLLCGEVVTADVTVKTEDSEKNCLVHATATFQYDGVQYDVTIAHIQPLTTKIMLQICKKNPKIFRVLGDYRGVYIAARTALIAAFAVIIIQYFW